MRFFAVWAPVWASRPVKDKSTLMTCFSGIGVVFLRGVFMCINSKRMVLGKHQTDKKWVLADTDCGTYECDECAEKIVRLHQLRIIEFFSTAPVATFVTITAHPKARGYTRSKDNLDKGMRKLFERMRRAFGTNHYVLIHETHKDGVSLHVHMLYAGAITQTWIREHAVACGMGRQCKAVRLRDPKASGFYVSKYLSKSLAEATFPKRFKRVRYSVGFPEFVFPDKPKEYSWIAVHKHKSELEAIRYFANRDGVLLKVVDKLEQIL